MATSQLSSFPLPNFLFNSNSKTSLRFLSAPLLNAAILGCLLVVIYLIAREFQLRKAKWPPGPRRLPILGNVHQLQSNVHVWLTKMAKTYGPLMTVWIGSAPVVVVSGQEAAWDAFVTQASNFASRPPQYTRRPMVDAHRTISSSQYGPLWSTLRRILHNSALSPSHLATHSSSHGRDVAVLMGRLVDDMKAKNGIVSPLPHLKCMAVSFLSALCFGSQFHDPDFVHRMEQLGARDIKMTGQAFLVDTLPFFVPWSATLSKRYEALLCDIMELLSPLIHTYRMNENAAASNCFLDALLSVQRQNSDFSDTAIALNLFELFVLAVDSTSTALEWALAYCVKHPRVQRKAYQELIQAVPGDRLVTWEDLPQLPYLQAIVKETLRKAGIAPLGIPHQTVNDCTLAGFHIPAGTVVLFNLHAISNDAAIWSEPHKFKPERFLSGEEKTSKFEFLPFGAGRRICGGMEVANMHVPITLGNLLKKFEWSCSEKSPAGIDMEEESLVFVRMMKHSLQLRNLVWATSKHDVYLMSSYSVMHRCSLDRKSTEVLNVAGPITPAREVQKNPWAVQQGLGRIQISTMCVKKNLMVAGGFQGEMIAKNLDCHGVSYCAKITQDENAITNAIEIYQSPSGATQLMTSNNDSVVRMFDVETFSVLRRNYFPWPVNHTSVSPDKMLVVVVGDHADGLLVDHHTGQVVSTLRGHLDYSFASAWHPDGRYFATGNQDTTCRIWDVRNVSSALTVLKGHIGAVRSLRFTSDGSFLAMAEPADFVHIFDVKRNYDQCQEIDLFGEIAGISFSPDTETLFIGVADRTYGSLLEYNRCHVNRYLDSLI